MYTLAIPVELPADRQIYQRKGFPIPPLAGGLTLSFRPPEHGFPFILQVSGFPTAREAEAFAPLLVEACLLVSLRVGFSVKPDTSAPVVAEDENVNSHGPVVYRTGTPRILATGSSVHGEDIEHFVRALDEAATLGLAAKLAANPKLKFAFELFAGVGLAGGVNAQFVTLITCLEVLTPAPANGQDVDRGRVRGFVRDTLNGVGHPDVKLIAQREDDLYVKRNSLVHEGLPVTPTECDELRKIVALVLTTVVEKP